MVEAAQSAVACCDGYRLVRQQFAMCCCTLD